MQDCNNCSGCKKINNIQEVRNVFCECDMGNCQVTKKTAENCDAPGKKFTIA